MLIINKYESKTFIDHAHNPGIKTSIWVNQAQNGRYLSYYYFIKNKKGLDYE